MPKDDKSRENENRFLEGLERWERPSSSSAVRVRASGVGTLADRFLRGLEDWERPIYHGGFHEVVLSPDRSSAGAIHKLLLKVKGSIEVIAGRADGVWAGTPVFLERVGRGLVRAVRLDSRGRVQFDQLSPGQYQVRTSPVSGFLGMYATAWDAAPEQSGTESMGSSEGKRDFPEYGLHASVERMPQSELKITFTTENPELAHAKVRFVFSERKTGNVHMSGEVDLDSPSKQSDQWVGTWQYSLRTSEKCELLFAVEPKNREVIPLSVSVLGVMVPKIIVNDAQGKALPSMGRLVTLTLTEEPMQGERPALRPSPGIVAWPEFTKASEDAFAWWIEDTDRQVDVVWAVEEAREGDPLPPLDGPSLGGAFAIGLTLLYYRGGGGTLLDRLESEFSKCLAHVDVSSVAISATVVTPGERAEAIRLGAVGQFKSKLAAARSLVVSDRQAVPPDVGPVGVIRASTVEEALNKIFDLQANNIFQL
jgi:hypothetical protein